MKSVLVGLIALLPLLASAQRKPASTQLVNRTGDLEVVVISRGAYQYLLTDRATKARYVPTNLTDSVKQQALDYHQTNAKPMPVVFSGTLQKTSSSVYTIGATDVPKPTGKAQNVILTALKTE